MINSNNLEEGAPGSPRAATAPRGARSSQRWTLLVVFAVYALIALFAYWPVWPGDPSRLPTCTCGDLVNAAWYLRWTPYALAHGHTPFASNWIDYPRGANLAQNTFMPLLGLIGAPLTIASGPVATFNLLSWIAFPISATACFAMLKRFVSWNPAAFIGGLFYGFSPYMVGQAWGHLNLTFVPIPPLVLLLVHELVVRQRTSARRTGLLLGLLAAVQLLISPEVLLSTALMSCIGLVVLVLSRRSQVRDKLAHALSGFAFAAMAFIPVAAYPLLFFLSGPNRYSGPPWGQYNFSADLLGTVVPTLNERFAPGNWAGIGARFVLGNAVENGSYLGIPLLCVLCGIIIWQRRSLLVRFAAGMAVITWVLSLGPRLVIDAHQTAIPLPFAALAHIPLLASLIEARFALYTDMFIAVIIAIALEGAWQRSLASRSPGPRERARHARNNGRLKVQTAICVAVVAIAALPLVPRWPYPSYATATPGFFTSASVLDVPANSVMLTYPYPAYPENQAMLWQAMSSMRFKLLGGYALIPNKEGKATATPFPISPKRVVDRLIADYAPPKAAKTRPTAPTTHEIASLTRSLLRRYRVDTVVLSWSGVNPAAAMKLFDAAIGSKPKLIGGVFVWLDVRYTLARVQRNPA